MEEKEITIDNLKIHYKIAGSGPAILILHGWGGSSDSWLKAQENLTNQGFKVICPDFPGFGKSKTPFAPWGVEDYCNFILDFTKNLNLQDFFLIGHSFGGRIAIKFATLYPERLIGLILVDTAGIEREKSLDLRQKIILKLLKFKYLIVSFPFLGKIFYPFLQRLSYFLAGTRDYYLIKSPVMKETFRKIISEDLTPYPAQIKVPTLIIWGEKDKIIPLKIAHLIKEKIPNSKLEIIPKAGHNPHLEVPEKLTEIIVQFIKS